MMNKRVKKKYETILKRNQKLVIASFIISISLFSLCVAVAYFTLDISVYSYLPIIKKVIIFFIVLFLEEYLRNFFINDLFRKNINSKGLSKTGKIIDYVVITHAKGRGGWNEYIPIIQLEDGHILKAKYNSYIVPPPIGDTCIVSIYKEKCIIISLECEYYYVESVDFKFILIAFVLTIAFIALIILFYK